MKLNWVTLRVSDLQKSLSFYNGLLNLNIAAKFGSDNHQIVMLGEENGTKIELIFEPHRKLENVGKGVSIGLEAPRLDELMEKIKSAGLNTEGPFSPNPRIRFFFVQDPDGYTIQLVEQK